MTRMREQDLDASGNARFVRSAAAGERRARERLPDQYAGLIRVGTAEFQRATQLRGAPASAGSRCARRRSVSCPATGGLGRGCS